MKTAHIAGVVVILSALTAAAQQSTPSPTPDALQILEKVNSFYSGAFAQLMTLTIAILAIAGVILPIVIQLIQSSISRNELKTLQTQIASELSVAREHMETAIDRRFTTVSEDVQRMFKEEREAMNKSVAIQAFAAKGMTFFLQGKVNHSQGRWSDAARDFAYASADCFRGHDDQNGQRSAGDVTF
jgi:hypothetical protein